jgi:UPF0716 family protein affecting phage T7 exclusion
MKPLVVGLFLLAVVEVALFRLWAEPIGEGLAWGILLTSAVAGIWSLRRGFVLPGRALERGLPVPEACMESVGHIIAGVLLVMPGLLSDVLGLALVLAAPFRRLVARRLLKYLGARLQARIVTGWGPGHGAFGGAPDGGGPAAPDLHAARPEPGAAPPAGPARTGKAPLAESAPPDPSRIRDVPFEVIGDDSPRAGSGPSS